jgi:uncharacterized membrane protein
MGEPKNLKDGNKTILAAYLGAHGVVLALAILGWPSSIERIKSIGAAEWGKAGVMVLITLVVTFVNRMGKDKLKLALVFWRIENALPGSSAFSEYAHKDPRVDIGGLKKAIGGEFPTDPGDQNRAWYRLYQQVRDSPSIQDAHKEYLLFRDIVWLTLPAAILCQGFLLYFRQFRLGVFHLLSCGAIYLLMRLAAIWSAQSLVRSVLAVSGAAHEPPKSQIVTA